jgi:hypothetical protein
MSSTLRYLGLIALALTAWLVIADLAGWVGHGVSDAWISKGIVIGLVCFGAGTLLRLFSPLRREIGRERCVECGVPIERGHLYCRDHLKTALDQARDRVRPMLQRKREP